MADRALLDERVNYYGFIFESEFIHTPFLLVNVKQMNCENCSGFPSKMIFAASMQSLLAVSPEMNGVEGGQLSVTLKGVGATFATRVTTNPDDFILALSSTLGFPQQESIGLTILRVNCTIAFCLTLKW